MDVPITGREAFYRTLLDMSFVATQDAAFAIDGPRDKVVLRCLRRLSALDYEEFEDSGRDGRPGGRPFRRSARRRVRNLTPFQAFAECLPA